MEKMNFGVEMTSVAEYINQVGKAEIIKALAGSAPSIQYFAQQLGVNEKTDLHLMSTTVTFKNGRYCEFNDGNSIAFSDRQLNPAFIKTEDSICANEMLGKWMGYAQKVTANDSEIPFEKAIVDSYVEATGEALENVIWNGITLGGTKYKGFADIVKEEGTKVAVEAGSDAYAQVRALILALPSKSAKKTELFLSPAKLMALKDALLKRDFRLIDLGGFEDENTIKMPVFGTLVHAVDGLAGDDNVYALVPEHAVYGTSVEGAHTDVAFVEDKVNDRYIMRIKLTAATQIAYPAETFYAEIAAA